VASGTPRTVKVTHRPTGTAYWAEKRTGFTGIEYNFGGGWCRSRVMAFAAARNAGQLREVRKAGPQ
jgi:hypothetical protein